MEKFLALMIFFFWWNSQIYTRQRKNSNKIPIVLAKHNKNFLEKAHTHMLGRNFLWEILLKGNIL